MNGILDSELKLKLTDQTFYPDASLLFALIRSNSNAHQVDDLLKSIFESDSSSQVSEIVSEAISSPRSGENENHDRRRDKRKNNENGDHHRNENGDEESEASYEEDRLMERPPEVDRSRMKKAKKIDGRTVERSIDDQDDDDDDDDANEKYDNNV